MILVAYEWHKLVGVRALWAFVVLCLVYNVFLVGMNNLGRDFFNDTSADAHLLGQRVDQAFLEGLAALPSTEHREVLLAAARGMENTYATYDTAELATYYGEKVTRDPLAVSLVNWKYELLQPQVTHLAATEAAMDVYVGPATHDSHWFLFGTLFETVVGEGALAGMLVMLFLVGHESQQRTDQVLYATKVGRGLVVRKVVAGMVAAVTLYVVLAVVSLAFYFALWDYGGVWDANVSSQFNYVVEGFFAKPFLTWTDFSVAGFTAAVVALGAALVAVCALLAAACGLLVRKVYAAALLLAAMLMGALVVRSALAEVGLWMLSFAFGFAPTSVWVSLPVWFTEMGLSAALPWQETIAVAFNAVLLTAACGLALRRFARKDVAPWNS